MTRQLTIEQHKTLGATLKTASRIDLAIINAYPKNSRETRSLLAVERAAGRARAILDSALAREQPTMPNEEFLNVYYHTGKAA